ncbi:MAG TPA: flagellar basal body P-ring protein FlgI [Polyangiaceae bacterium]|nr:flagellar basal body P-ring protein FlgI [Polyangiaceae bacterium]
MPKVLCRLVLALTLAAATLAPPAKADHLRDLCDVVGARDNQLIGYGVVTGLQQTGDDISVPFAAQSLLALMRRLGVQVDTGQLRLRNVAAVVITASIPPFARPGAHLDVTVSSIGNARSLSGGVLVQSPLHGADLHVYAVAQGPLVLGGFEAKGSSGSSVRTNITTTARIPAGALVEREIPMPYAKDDVITLALRQGDFVTTQRIVEAVNKELGNGAASALDGGAVRVKAPGSLAGKPVELLAKIGDIDVEPSNPARVIVNERTGTIVAGGNVRLSPVAIAQGGLTIVIKETPTVSQPNAAPFGRGGGTTVVTPRTEIIPQETIPQPSLTYVEGAATLADVTRSLAALGLGPRELASILQALRSAGALHAEIVMQ